ncbi:hypothetical protein AABB24_007799 [Solanum stoloniferum]|uniref:Late blight resistance protein n=1 Tax=Solanum stoloniferum TaxID=62892 RepID=A0ABD2UQP7_9SOLN
MRLKSKNVHNSCTQQSKRSKRQQLERRNPREKASLPSPNCSSPDSHVQSILWLRDGATSRARAVGLIETIHAATTIQISWDLDEISYPQRICLDYWEQEL